MPDRKPSEGALLYIAANYGDEINEILGKIAGLIGKCDGSFEEAADAAAEIGKLVGDLTGIGFLAGVGFTSQDS